MKPEASSPRRGNHYGRPLEVKIERDALVVRIGIQTLAHAISYADWANPYDETRHDYVRTFAIEDAGSFARDVLHAMLNEREDGSTPLSDFLDKMSQAAIEDGSEGLYDGDVEVLHGQTHHSETWAQAHAEAQPASNTPPKEQPGKDSSSSSKNLAHPGGLEPLVTRFLEKYDRVIASQEYQGWQMMAHIHSVGGYTGENWFEELQAVREALLISSPTLRQP